MKSYFIGKTGQRICITTNVDLSADPLAPTPHLPFEKDSPVSLGHTSSAPPSQTLSRPEEKPLFHESGEIAPRDTAALPKPERLERKKHYILYPGRSDHALKYAHFMKKFVERGENVWCVDPFGQGATDGGALCEVYDKTSSRPCCARKGHGTWQAYSETYLTALQAIQDCLTTYDEAGHAIRPQLVLVAHSMAANVDMWSRLETSKRLQLKSMVAEVHYIAPMISHTLFLREKIGAWGEEGARFLLALLTGALTALGKGTQDLIIGGGVINPFELTPEAIADKIHPQHRETFINICQSHPAFEIGMVTNQWFWESYKACRHIRRITSSCYPPGRITVHVPGGDRIVYPDRVEAFFEAYLPYKHALYTYEGEPHSLFWGSEGALTSLVESIITG